LRNVLRSPLHSYTIASEGLLGLSQTIQQYFAHVFAAGCIILPDDGQNPNNFHLHPQGRDAMEIELTRQPPLADLIQGPSPCRVGC